MKKHHEPRCNACNKIARKRVRRAVLYLDGKLEPALVCGACARRASGIVSAVEEHRPKRPPIDGREQLLKLRGQCKAFAQAARDACDGSKARSAVLQKEDRPRIEHEKHAAFHDGRSAAFEAVAAVVDGILVEWRAL